LLPKELVFELHYLGGTELSYTLNFSRPGAQVVVQNYNLIHLGFSGYREVMENCLANARILSKSLEATGWYTCVSDIHRPSPSNPNPDPSSPETSALYTAGLPVVSFHLTDAFREEFPHIKQETISLLLRARQWIIPNYALPPNEAAIEILRIVVRVNLSFDLLDRLVTDIVHVTEMLIVNDEVDLAALRDQERLKKLVIRRWKEKGAAKKLVKEAEDVKKIEKGIHRTVC
jgi:glutamate decarboxylase